VGHGHSLYEEMLHSPFILRYPNRVPQGRRVPHLVSMVDVAPTLYEIAGLESHDKVEGISVLDVLDGVGDPRPRIAVSDFLFRQKSFRAGRYHWITNGRGGKLYDVVSDRKEKRNVIKRHPIARAFVRSQAGVFLGAEDKTKWWVNEGREAAKMGIEADHIEIDDDLQKQLEAMGYVDGAKGDAPDKK
jgi:arylsulfatase A-like enzyme